MIWGLALDEKLSEDPREVNDYFLDYYLQKRNYLQQGWNQAKVELFYEESSYLGSLLVTLFSLKDPT